MSAARTAIGQDPYNVPGPRAEPGLTARGTRPTYVGGSVRQ